jgi:transcriptional regulator with XRE-family HTH domain
MSERPLSQEKLAELAGLHPTYISSAEHEGRNITIDNMEQIASALKVEHYQLLVITRT